MIAVMLPLFWYTRARYRPGLLVGVFAALIASARFTVEFFREPDAQLADFALRTGLSMGQWLTIPLILGSLGLIGWALTRLPVTGPSAAGTSVWFTSEPPAHAKSSGKVNTMVYGFNIWGCGGGAKIAGSAL